MKRLILFFSLLLALACARKTNRLLYEMAQTTSSDFSFSDAALVYDSSLISISANSATLKPLYSSLTTFNDGTDQGYSSSITAIGGSFTSGPIFSALNLAFTSAANWVGVANTSSTLTDYVTVVDFSASTFDGSNTLSMCLRMQPNLDDHYLLNLAAGTADISVRAAAAFSSLGTAAVSLTPAVDTTYRLRASAIGNSFGFRVWDSSSADPGADQLTVTDATYSNGYPCLISQAGITGIFDNVRIGDSTFVSDYSMANPTIVFPAVPVRSGLLSLESTISATGSDDVRFDVSLDNGVTYLAWDGSAWSQNNSGRAGANSLSAFSNNLNSLALPTENRRSVTYTIRAHLHSELGFSAPSMTSPRITYR